MRREHGRFVNRLPGKTMKTAFAFVLCVLCLDLAFAVENQPVRGETAIHFTPEGLDYERYGYDLTSSENLDVVYAASEKPRGVVPLGFRLFDLKGNLVKEGEINPCATVCRERVNRDIEVVDGKERLRESKAIRWRLTYRVMASNDLKTLSSGWYTIKTRIDGRPAEFAYKVLYRNTASLKPPAKQIAFLADCMDPEGVGQWLHENLSVNAEITSSLLNGRKDLVVIESIADLSPETMALLEIYLNQGGKVLIAGHPSVALQRFLPVTLEGDRPYSDQAHALVCADTRKPFLARESKYYHINAHLKPGARCLAEWNNGTPALASMVYGRGTVFYYGSEIKDQVLYAALLSRVLGEVVTVRNFPEKENGNVKNGVDPNCPGRFGWTQTGDGESALQMLIKDGEYCLRLYSYMNFYQVGVGFEERMEKSPNIEVRRENWVSKEWNLRGEKFGASTVLTFSLATPGALFSPAATERRITLTLPEVQYAAWKDGKNANSIQISTGDSYPLSSMSENWLLFWQKPSGKYAVPILVVFSTKPQSLTQDADGHIAVIFDQPIKHFTVLPLRGVALTSREDVAAWAHQIPKGIVEQCTRMGQMVLAKAVGCTETYEIDGKKKTITVHDAYDYRILSDDWNTRPLVAASLPPVLSLMKANNPRFQISFSDIVTDTGYSTYWGPLVCALGKKSISYTLPLPETAYPLGTPGNVAVVNDEVNKRLKKRMVEEVLYANSGNIGGALRKNLAPVKEKPQTWAGWTLYAPRGEGVFDADICAAHYPYFADDYLAMVTHPCLDWYRVLGYYFGALVAYPYLDDPDDREAMKRVEYVGRVNFQIVANLFGYKTFVRYRTEPFSGMRYLVNFMFPTVFEDEGFRYWSDNNESFGIVLYAFYLDGLMLNDWDTVRANWEMMKLISRWPRGLHDWAWMASMASDRGNANADDMLNSEYAGWIAYAQIAERINDPAERSFGLYMAAKASVASLARVYLPSYAREIGVPLKTGVVPTGGITGYAESYMILDTVDWILDQNNGNWVRTGLDLYDTSKGLQPHLANLYAKYIPDQIRAYETLVGEAARRKGVFAGGMVREAVKCAIMESPLEMHVIDSEYDDILKFCSLEKWLGVNASAHCGYYPIIMENRSRVLRKVKQSEALAR